MAPKSTVAERINTYLEYDRRMLADLPDIAEEWERLSVEQRASWGLEWDQMVGSDLQFLERQFKTGTMDLAQRRRYREIIERITALRFEIERLGLFVPQISTDVA